MENNTEGGSKAPRRIALALAAAALIALSLLAVSKCSSPGDWFDPSAREGSYSGKTEEQIVADLNKTVAEGMMNISIASTIAFDQGDGVTGRARIENIQANHFDQKVVLSLDDTGEVIWESGAIAPGYSIDEITANRALEPGAYDATATFSGFDPETHEETGGKLAAQVKLAVS